MYSSFHFLMYVTSIAEKTLAILVKKLPFIALSQQNRRKLLFLLLFYL